METDMNLCPGGRSGTGSCSQFVIDARRHGTGRLSGLAAASAFSAFVPPAARAAGRPPSVESFVRDAGVARARHTSRRHAALRL